MTLIQIYAALGSSYAILSMYMYRKQIRDELKGESLKDKFLTVSLSFLLTALMWPVCLYQSFEDWKQEKDDQKK